VLFSGCAGDTTFGNQFPPLPLGSLDVSVNPASATVVVMGQENFKQTFTGNFFITDLAPGQYRATVSAPGFTDAISHINVIAGQVSTMALILQARRIVAAAPRAVYRDEQGNLIALESSDLRSGMFFFYAWLQDKPMGISPSDLAFSSVIDPIRPLSSEQRDSMPSFTQNLAAAWVGFRDKQGIVRPVIGADVHWKIDQRWSGRVNRMLFGTSDDNGMALGYGLFDNKAYTRTNNAHLAAESFPIVANGYQLYNQTGIGTPFVDGFSWVALLSPDATATARIVAVATINGQEIGQQILYKSFASAPEIEISKTVDSDIVNLVDGEGLVTWTVTIKNVGTGDATNVDLSDFLASGEGASYMLGALPVGSVAAGDGFTASFPLASEITPDAQLLGNARSFAVLASATVTNTGASVVNGNVGVSAGLPASGFPPGVILNGTIHNNDAVALDAETALTTAYLALGERACTGTVNIPLSNNTLTPGVYCYDSSVGLTGSLILDAQNDPAAEFIFKIGSTLTTATGAAIRLINGASPCNVYWQIGSSATLGTDTIFIGNILAQASITANTRASISGRALARTGAVTLDMNEVNAPLSCGVAADNTKTITFKATVTAPGTYCNEAQIISYNDADNVWTPIDLKAQACFTAIESNVSIVKDFVADDGTTSLGKSLTVAANVPIRLRLRVINSGTGSATGVSVNDELTSGDLAPYQLIEVSAGTPNSRGGFDTTIGNLAAATTTTLLFTVAASADGTYCDTATISALSGSIGIGTDSACLTVATPILTIEKSDAPASVIPGGSYTSTIIVNNIGPEAANNVVISDIIGLDAAANVRAIYLSSSLNGASGTLTNNLVTANAVDIPAGARVTFTIVSRIPLGAVSGTYCDTANATSNNAVSPRPASDCVEIPAFSALQTGLVDLDDPINTGNNVTYFSTLYVEELSNEGVSSNRLMYSFGLKNPTILGIPGVFQEISTKVYLDTQPLIDPITGLVISNMSSPTAVFLLAGIDYMVDNTTTGLQLLTLTPSFVLQPNSAIYIVHVVLVPSGTPAFKLYTTNYTWDSFGLIDSTHTYEASSSEPTTVLP
jgi:uncharacterized repeat protein (TIGR01451 family)